MPSKEEFRKHIEVGIEYARRNAIPYHTPDLVNHLTDHLWGTVGMWLNNAKQQVDKREYTYNEPAREIERPHMAIDEIDEHEGDVFID